MEPSRVCMIDGCDRPLYARGLCSAHYARLRKTGSPGGATLRVSTQGMTPAERFGYYVDASGGFDACHVWTGRTNGLGYGLLSVGGGRHVGAHRWVLGVSIGRELVPGEEAMHLCDNPPCCNPRHLRVGTHAENMADMLAKGRGTVPPTSAENAVKTHCVRGHEFDLWNTYVSPQGKRECRVCNKIRHDRYLARKRAAAS